MSSTLKMDRSLWLLLGLLSVLWGGSFIFARVALADIPPLTLVFARVAIAGLALGVLIKARGERLPAGRSLWGTFAVMGLINNLIPFSLLFFGQTYIGAGLASIFNSLVPLFTVIVAHFTTADEKLNAAKLFGIGLGVAGVALMFGVDLGTGIDGWTVAAMSACVLAAVSYALASIYGRRFHARSVPPLCVAFGQVTASAVMMLPVALFVDQPWTLAPPGGVTLLAILGLGLLSTALAYVLYFRILARGGATNISLVTLLIPVSAVSLGAVLLGERLNVGHFFGMGLILLGLVALDGRAWQALRRARARRRAPATSCASG
ncbi:MAG: DMT family transporter [Pseudomonadota bacterium]